MRRIFGTLAAAGALLAAPAIAQDAPAAPSSDEAATIERAGLIFRLFANAVDNQEIPIEEKNGLIGCLYSNTLETLSVATGETLTNNPEIDASDPVNVYVVAAIICGARQPGEAPADPAPAQ
ncbi:hypothetical protein [Alteriqipengyuania lutimaris]|uniref:DUF732 domain-containing protein n=1 Tax=Alteriqipengyuania lutimaris TaxID=1538146 RepID=A0A395LLI3_9SPHN|nr:hypothetical protein [Alteriqipengyuania lutimaris]MBB3033045.1 hypothetical protein [Alteriqipengyuania lutimaris]RDS77883.1 hypothetical protein DL238_09925 [Alteriqipengyuania lutimaris]